MLGGLARFPGMRLRTVIVVLAVAAVSCTSASPDLPPEPARNAEEAVTRWLAGVDRVDVDELRVVVERRGLAVLIGVENQLTPAEIVSYITAGIPEPTLQTYWSSFRADFEAFTLEGIDDIETGSAFPFTVRDRLFAAIPATVPGGGTTEIITVETNGVWRVDFLATFGPGFVRGFASLFEDDDADIRQLAEVVNTPLRAGMSREPGDEISDELSAEIDALLLRIEEIVSS